MSGDAPAAPESILVVGAGKMGSALVRGWLGNGISPAAVTLLDPAFATGGDDWADTSVTLHADVSALDALQPDVLLLAVKPQIMPEALNALRTMDRFGLVVVSIAAGIRLETLQDAFPSSTVVRTMPNTPSAVGQGVTACFSAGASLEQRALVTSLLEAVGQVVWVDDEGHMDGVTALSGSGPAYVFHMVEAMAQAGEALGLDAQTAQVLARQTVVGAGALLAGSSDSAATLRENVTSPGGTTQAGLSILQESGALADLMERTLEAAYRRSVELASSDKP